MLEEESQRALFSLGVFSVRADSEGKYADRLLETLDKEYKLVTTPDPFWYYANREALLQDAVLAGAGDAQARERFFQRLGVVIGG